MTLNWKFHCCMIRKFTPRLHSPTWVRRFFRADFSDYLPKWLVTRLEHFHVSKENDTVIQLCLSIYIGIQYIFLMLRINCIIWGNIFYLFMNKLVLKLKQMWCCKVFKKRKITKLHFFQHRLDGFLFRARRSKAVTKSFPTKKKSLILSFKTLQSIVSPKSACNEVVHELRLTRTEIRFGSKSPHFRPY